MEILTSTSTNQHQHQHQPKSNHSTSSDLAFLAILTSQYSHSTNNSNLTNPNLTNHRRPQLDPLILETASLSGPHQTRNHYLHEYFPHSNLSKNDPKSSTQKTISIHSHFKEISTYVSQQAPRSSKQISSNKSSTTNHNLNTNGSQETFQDSKRNPVSIEQPITHHEKHLKSIETQISKSSSVEIKEPDEVGSQTRSSIQEILKLQLESIKTNSINQTNKPKSTSKVKVNCKARTRIPTSKGPIWLHVYENSIDQKEHLAIVMNPLILSKSLNEIKSTEETDLERIIRGALPLQEYLKSHDENPKEDDQEKPIVRIHSECFTGETIGSNRCDCGYQLTHSIEYILNLNKSNGLIIYLRQEGRGIGLEKKLKAYNLQDLGFDTIESNLLLGFDDDLRNYDLGIQILKDFGLKEIKLMTNNPKKILSLQAGEDQDGIEVVERIPIVLDQKDEIGDEVKGYLRTKILKMGHMIDLPHF